MYFVTDEELIADAINRKVDPEAPEVRAEFMHLLKLEGLMKLTGSSDDVAEVSLVKHCLPPNCRDSTPFLSFPFSDTASQLNSATKNLPLLDHLWFKFNNARDNALQEPVKQGRGTFGSIMLSFESYLALKKDVETETYKV